jgi:hypothetical protein
MQMEKLYVKKKEEVVVLLVFIILSSQIILSRLAWNFLKFPLNELEPSFVLLSSVSNLVQMLTQLDLNMKGTNLW